MKIMPGMMLGHIVGDWKRTEFVIKDNYLKWNELVSLPLNQAQWTDVKNSRRRVYTDEVIHFLGGVRGKIVSGGEGR